MSGSGQLVRDTDCVSRASQVQRTPLERMVSVAVHASCGRCVLGCAGAVCGDLPRPPPIFQEGKRPRFVIYMTYDNFWIVWN